MGVGDFIHNPLPFDAPHSQSVYVPDYIINPHPRFAALTRNIRNRRGKKVDIRVPLFKDTHTPEFQVSDRVAPNTTISPFGHKAEEGQEIHMDAMAFGMGMCCLVSIHKHSLIFSFFTLFLTSNLPLFSACLFLL